VKAQRAKRPPHDRANRLGHQTATLHAPIDPVAEICVLKCAASDVIERDATDQPSAVANEHEKTEATITLPLSPRALDFFSCVRERRAVVAARHPRREVRRVLAYCAHPCGRVGGDWRAQNEPRRRDACRDRNDAATLTKEAIEGHTLVGMEHVRQIRAQRARVVERFSPRISRLAMKSLDLQCDGRARW